MFKFIVAAALIACVAAQPGVLAPVAAPFAYANAPLYAAGGSSQVDVRNNYDGTLSSYTTAPFEYTGPYSSRYVSGIPAAPAPVVAAAPAPVVAKYTAPVGTPFAAPYLAGAASPYVASPYAASPYVASPYVASPYFASPYAAAPFAAPAAVAAAPAAAAVAAPAPVVV